MAGSPTRNRTLAPTNAPSGARLQRGTVPKFHPKFDRTATTSTTSMAFSSFQAPDVSPTSHDEAIAFLLNHATAGFTVPDYFEAKAMGYNAWLDWQLDYLNIDDAAVDTALAGYGTLTMTNKQLYETYQMDQNTVIFELQEANLLRSIYSRKQLYERMVEFWTDHFNINQLDEFAIWFKTTDDRRVVRENALGSFPEMLRRSPTSAAMLWYLDNYNNVAGSVQENYARELLELHTLGVNGPYTEMDVVEVARCFTGWTFHGVFTNGPFGKFTYVDGVHDNGQKVVLGQTIPANGGITDGEVVLDLLAMHPATAEFISTKMAKWLLTYDPPQALVDRLTQIYLNTAGSIKPMVRHILKWQTVSSIPAADRRKLKRPYHMLTSAMRAAQVPSTDLLNLTLQLLKMGNVPYWYPTPDGYPDTVNAWGKALLPRWEWNSLLFGRDIEGNKPEIVTLQSLLNTAPAGGTVADGINWVMTGGAIEQAHVDSVQAFIDSQTTNPNAVLREAFALMATSPSYQYY
ncbi:MAG: hypothetical protein ACI8QC_003836 [Planctomycetota bacterium]|jgi:uncharacterized protein (DUF1800 family)